MVCIHILYGLKCFDWEGERHYWFYSYSNFNTSYYIQRSYMCVVTGEKNIGLVLFIIMCLHV